MAAMSDDALKSLVASRKNAAVNFLHSTFAADRIEALKFYRGDPLGDEEEGLSTVVSRDVMEAVESMLPSLMRPFISGDEVVRFEPVGEEDEDQAEQATDYVNYLFTKRNDSFKFIYNTMKDGLLMRLGIAKVVREEYTDDTKESYGGLDEMQLDALKSDPAITIDKKRVTPGSVMGMQTWDVQATRSKDKAKIACYALPPDEFLYERQLADLDDATFLAHRARKTIADLIDMGFDRDTCLALPDGDLQDFNQERLVRFNDETIGDYGNTEHETRLVWVTEAYIKCAYDGETAAWRRVVLAGSDETMLLNDECDGHPFAAWTPIPIPHKLAGMSIADMTRDLQLIKTALWRESLNNAYLTNRPQREVVDGQVNIDDLLTPRIGGIIRVKSPGMIKDMTTPFTAGDSFQLIEYADTTREQRTGVTRYNQGMDANSLNKTATGISAIMSASQQRQELVARMYAEFLKRIFRKFLELTCKYPDDAEVQRLTNKKAVPSDPREWSTEYDMTVSVGLGTGDRTAEVQHMMQLLQMDEQIIQLQGGAQGPIVTMENVYEKLKKLVQSMGIKGVDRYYTDPAEQQPQPQQPDPQAVAAQAQQQAEQAKLQDASQQMQAKLALEAHNADQARQLDFHKATLAAQTAIEVARIGAESRIIVAGMKTPPELMAEAGDGSDDEGPADTAQDATGSPPGGQEQESAPQVTPEQLAALQAHFAGRGPMDVQQPQQPQRPDYNLDPEMGGQ